MILAGRKELFRGWSCSGGSRGPEALRRRLDRRGIPCLFALTRPSSLGRRGVALVERISRHRVFTVFQVLGPRLSFLGGDPALSTLSASRTSIPQSTWSKDREISYCLIEILPVMALSTQRTFLLKVSTPSKEKF